jgi:hypothetical protein
MPSVVAPWLILKLKQTKKVKKLFIAWRERKINESKKKIYIITLHIMKEKKEGEGRKNLKYHKAELDNQPSPKSSIKSWNK